MSRTTTQLVNKQSFKFKPRAQLPKFAHVCDADQSVQAVHLHWPTTAGLYKAVPI